MTVKFRLKISLNVFKLCFYVQALICVIWKSILFVNRGTLYLSYQYEPPQTQKQQLISSEQNKVQKYA